MSPGRASSFVGTLVVRDHSSDCGGASLSGVPASVRGQPTWLSQAPRPLEKSIGS
ncbi:hypothetical protein BG618_04668 [Pseudonocardia autotrophica]|nr:hypothetical protein BG618_04668 [Pseudonocardia autotrophica]